MKKLEGLHFYIDICNLDEIIQEEEENNGGKINHSIHALDAFFSAIERFGKDKFVVEKITNSRIHLYVVGNIEDAYDTLEDTVTYAYKTICLLNEESKYKSLSNFKINIGADYGCFYDFEFSHKNLNEPEQTTIGYPANFAAKLQSLTSDYHMSISKKIYDHLPDEKQRIYEKVYLETLEKYEQECMYECNILEIKANDDYKELLEETKTRIRELNLKDMVMEDARKPINADDLSVNKLKDIEGIPFYADIRGFTKQFDEDGSNLDEMARKTSTILTTMYDTVKENNGIHIQFQGDRESALFHNYGDYKCYKDAIITGLRLIDKVKEYKVCIGIGEEVGRLFVTRIGTRGMKDNIILGSTVIRSSELEDYYANENELVIGNELYKKLKDEGSSLIKLFERRDNCYVTNRGHKYYKGLLMKEKSNKDYKNKEYHGAWSNQNI